MTQYLIKQGSVFSLGSISTVEDLTVSRPGLGMDPPPPDARCECCRRHLCEVPPFGKAGDPLRGDFEGERLVVTWEPMGPYDAEAEHIFDTFFGSCSSEEDWTEALARLAQAYGQERADAIYWGVQLAGAIVPIWLCRACIVLTAEERFGKRLATRLMAQRDPP